MSVTLDSNQMKNKIGGRELKILEELTKKPLYAEQLCRIFHLSYSHIHSEIAKLRKKGFVSWEINREDNRKRDLVITKTGLIELKKIQTRKSAIAKLDGWLDKKFREIGIDAEALLKW